MPSIRVTKFALLFTLALPVFFDTGALAASEEQVTNGSNDVVFIPPEIGAPGDRMGAGTRGTLSGDDTAMLTLLVPEGGGLTTLSSPPLVWRLAHGHRGNLIIGLNPLGSLGVELQLQGPFPPGDYGLDLGRSDYTLETGRIYEWHVALIDQQSGAVLERAKALIERFPDQMKAQNPAAAGLWFDALAQLVEIGLSGRVRATDATGFGQLLETAGVGH